MELVERELLGGGLVACTLQGSEHHLSSYQSVGQYVQVTINAQQAYFYLAGTPHSNTWRLVVRPSGAVAEALCSLPLGSSLEVSDARGDGFALHLMQDAHVALMLVGSGFGAAFSILQTRLDAGKAAQTHIYLGVRDLLDPPAPRFLEQVQRSGCTVTLCTLDPPSLSALPTFPFIVGDMVSHLEGVIAGAPLEWVALGVGPSSLLSRLDSLKEREPRLRHVLRNS